MDNTAKLKNLESKLEEEERYIHTVCYDKKLIYLHEKLFLRICETSKFGYLVNCTPLNTSGRRFFGKSTK